MAIVLENAPAIAVPTPDASALHIDVAGEINSLAEKVTPVDADLLLIEDSADSNNKKKVQISNLSGGNSWEKIETKHVVGAAVDTIEFTGLSGNLIQKYKIEYNIIHGNPGTVREFRLLPNGLTTDLASSQNPAIGGSSAGRAALTILRTQRNNSVGNVHLIATRTPEGSSVERDRAFFALGETSDTPVSAGGSFMTAAGGSWSGTAELTSMKITCNIDNTNTLQAEMAVGTIVTLYKWVE